MHTQSQGSGAVHDALGADRLVTRDLLCRDQGPSVFGTSALLGLDVSATGKLLVKPVQPSVDGGFADLLLAERPNSTWESTLGAT
jgi:hypothetical protein